MSPFRFRLDRMLRLREHEEEERARTLAGARDEERTERERVDRANQRLTEAGAAAVPKPGATATAGAMSMQRLTVDAAQHAVETSTAAHQEAAARVVREEEGFGEARKDRRVLERLRERRLGAWRTEEDRIEQGTIDEQALVRRARKENAS